MGATPNSEQAIEPPVALTPSLRSLTSGRSGSIPTEPDRTAVLGLDFSRPLPPPPLDDKPSMPSPPANATTLSRSGTLSWQQRPSSRGVGPRSRPLSFASTPDPGPAAHILPQDNAEEGSRKDIATSLAAKDPSYFRQTADRGVRSAAYRKNQANAETETGTTFTSRGMKLPGMSKTAEDRSMEEPEKTTPPSSPLKSDLALPVIRSQPSHPEEAQSMRQTTTVSSSPTKSPALNLPSFNPLELNTTFAMDAPGLGRTSSILSTSARPPSPTKGLGGFVESAMMKRSDSVSKRWSVQANAGLKRGDSVASSRPPHLSGISGFTPGHSRASSRDVRGVRESNSSPLTGSRPTSSHGLEAVPSTKGRPLPQLDNDVATSQATIGGQTSEAGSADTSQAPQQSRAVTPPPSSSLLLRSPSKTMDPRRWSPTKSSWLESALKKPPDSPKFAAAKPETPIWKLNMQRAREEQQASSSEIVEKVLVKPETAPRPFLSPQLKRSAISDIGSDGDHVSSAHSKADSVKSVPHPTSLEAKPRTSEMGESIIEKIEKPVVPSKRNVTSIKSAESPGSKLESPPAKPAPVEERRTILPGEATIAPSLRATPQTPPKTDFRASLKSRQAPSTGNNESEPEFKAVFGKLKRTQTQNYVAPDLLKHNITQGKEALSVTGGPQKPKRVDEFKESILQKKEAMKISAGTVAKRSDATSPSPKPADYVPEALARRMTLQKSGSFNDQIVTKKAVDVPPKSIDIAAKLHTALRMPDLNGNSPKLSISGSQPQSAAENPMSMKKDVIPTPKLTPTPHAKPTTTNAEENNAVTTPIPPLRPRSVPHTQTSEPKLAATSCEDGPQAEASFKVKLPENSKLATRLNPALASILSRSGSPKQIGDPSSDGGRAIQVRDIPQLSPETTKSGSAELTHVTKARAKGPKRRAPKSGLSSSDTTEPSTKQPASSSLPSCTPEQSSSGSLPESRTALLSRDFASKPTKTRRPEPDEGGGKRPLPILPKAEVLKPTATEQPGAVMPSTSTDLQAMLLSEPHSNTKPTIATKPAEVRKISSTAALSTPVETATPLKPKKSADLRKVSNLPSKSAEEPVPLKSSTPKTFGVLADFPKLISSPPESDVEKKWASPSPLPLTPSKSRLNTSKAPKAPKSDMDHLTKPRLSAPSKANGLGLQLDLASNKSAATPILTPPPDSEATVAKAVASPIKPVLPTKKSVIRGQLEDFLGALPHVHEKAEFDTHAFLSAQTDTKAKSKTVSKQIWEVSGDGKKTPMPPRLEHILFEDCMYLCVHSLQSLTGSKASEVYLWCGDEVPEAAIEDAQLFCRKMARENSTKLMVLKQGKESSEFFQALGGIVIVRRNKSSASYMLCGRRHLGHFAFDEVDLSADSLCPGLPFLISAKFGKLYLWKGAGSNQEDVGCARLIGTDMGLAGEIEEVSQGEEPPTFWESFSPPVKPSEAPAYTQGYQGYDHAPRLYRVEHDRPKSSGGFWGLRAASPPKQPLRTLVEEIAPFSQRDLDDNHIHILDTYGELHV